MNATTLYVVLLLASAVAWMRSRKPILALPFVVALSLAAGESYPFSNYPMYSDPDRRENYLYLARAEQGRWAPLPLRSTTGISAPTLKKLYKARYRARAAAEPSGNRPRPTGRDTRARSAGEETLAFLNERAAQRGRPLSPSTALIEVWIEWDSVLGYRERTRMVARLDGVGS